MISIDDREFAELTEYLKRCFGINLTRKKSLIEGRLSNLIVEKGYDNFSDYLKQVFSDPTRQELTVLVNKLTTNHTFFMREADHFEFFRDRVLPHLAATEKERDLRIWSAGCSSGEEPYTLAMILAEFFGDDRSRWNTKILATDISVCALETAERGIYSAESIAELPKLWQMSHFSKVDQENYQISSQLRREIIFRIFNLMDNVFPFKKKFHTIFCRNVMIYFEDDIKLRLVRKFYDMTEPGGYLFIGHAESISKFDTGYRYVMPAVYRKG